MYKPRCCRRCSRVSLLSASYAPFYVTASLWENGVGSPLPPTARGSPAPPGRGRVTKAKPNSRHFAYGLERSLRPPSPQCPFCNSGLHVTANGAGLGAAETPDCGTGAEQGGCEEVWREVGQRRRGGCSWGWCRGRSATPEAQTAREGQGFRPRLLWDRTRAGERLTQNCIL